MRREIEMDTRVEKGANYTEPVRDKLSNSWGWWEKRQGVVRKSLPVRALVHQGVPPRSEAKGKTDPQVQVCPSPPTQAGSPNPAGRSRGHPVLAATRPSALGRNHS